MDIPMDLDLLDITLSDNGSGTGDGRGDDTGENSDCDGFDDQEEEEISDEELNRKFHEDMKVETC